eukprot:350048-Chlamydomonas_euryale.AAC.14
MFSLFCFGRKVFMLGALAITKHTTSNKGRTFELQLGAGAAGGNGNVWFSGTGGGGDGGGKGGDGGGKGGDGGCGHAAYCRT